MSTPHAPSTKIVFDALAASSSEYEAAAHLNVPITTLRRWIRSAKFNRRFRQELERMANKATQQLVGLAPKAIRQLSTDLEAADPADTTRAARVILEHANTALDRVLGLKHISELEKKIEAYQRSAPEQWNQ